MSFTTIDLFCGAGGLTEGFSKAGFKSVFATDFDRQAIETFQFNHPSVPVWAGDISELQSEAMLNQSGLGVGEIDVLMGGPPCQGFSLAGPRLSEDPKNHLFLEFLRLARSIKPKFLLFENVPGIMSWSNGAVVEALKFEIESFGYHVTSTILDAHEFGVPQARKRFILVASRDRDDFEFPEPTHRIDCQDLLLGNSHLPIAVTVSSALSDLPVIQQGGGSEILEHHGDYFNEYQLARRGFRRPGTIFNHRATRHCENVSHRYSLIPQGKDNKSIPSALRTKKNNVFRLDPGSPSRTVTCNFRTDLINPWQPRGTTVREAARLQSFDDDYQFFGNLTRKAAWLTQDDQVGNAVPPVFAEVLAQQIKKFLR